MPENTTRYGETYPKSDLFNKASEALKLAERIGVTAAARELSLYESQLYNWRSKQQNQQTSSERELEMSTEIARLKRQLAERDEELAILQKAATYFAKRLK